jgi:hypothetical protein
MPLTKPASTSTARMMRSLISGATASASRQTINGEMEWQMVKEIHAASPWWETRL